MKQTPTIRQKLYRFRDAALVLAVSESQVRKFVGLGVLRAIHIPGIRARRLVGDDVDALAEKWAQAGEKES